MAQFFNHKNGGILVKRLVDGHHHAHVHQNLDHFSGLDCEQLGKLGDDNGLGDRDITDYRCGRL